MKCFKILLLVSLIIPLVLRGVSLLGNVIPAAAPPQQPSTSGSGNAGVVSSASASSRVGRSHLSGFAQRRFGGDGGGGFFFFRDDKRFSPTGSNPLHNL